MIAARKRPGSSEPKRMAPAAIRAATPFPKPKGAIDALFDFLGERHARGPLDSKERELLRAISERADLLDAREVGADYGARYWILVPLCQDELDQLAHFEAERAEMEGEDEREPETDRDDSYD